MKKYSNNIGASFESFASKQLPQPIEKETNFGWVSIGEDNQYLQWLNSLYYQSGIHGGIINQKNFYICGGGIDFKTPYIYSAKTDYEALCKAISLDLEIAESFAILWTKISSNGENIWIPEHTNIELWRPDKERKVFHYSEDWSKTPQTEKQNYRIVKDIKDVDALLDKECLAYYKTSAKQTQVKDKGGKTKLSCSWFPVPRYSGAIDDINTSIGISTFNYNETKNGYKGGTVVYMNQPKPDNEEVQKKVEDSIRRSASEESKQGGIAIIWNGSNEHQPKIEQLSGNDLDTRYNSTIEVITDSIMIAHSVVNPTLFGIKSNSNFGNSGAELLTAYSLFKESYVNSRQQVISKEINKAIERLNSVKTELYFKDFTPNFTGASSQNEAVEILSSLPALLQNAIISKLTNDELRAFINFKPTVLPTQMSVELDPVCALFSSVGIERNNLAIYQSNEIEDFSKLDESENALLQKRYFAKVDKQSQQILSMLSNGENFDSIKNALNISAKELISKIDTLKSGGYISSSKILEITDKGIGEINQDKFEVRYSYEKRPDAPELVEGGKSRDFCVTMLELDRLYTREEINTISGAIGRDVFSYRGGWYTNHETKKSQPSCRHYWKQNVVIKK
jgi:hypothetical protein